MQHVWEVGAYLGFVLAFGLFWCSICWLLALLSGWRRLAVRFPTAREPGNGGWRWVGGSFYADFLPVHFNGALIVHVDRQGIRFACRLPGLGAFTPFLLPWGELESVKTGRALFGRSARIRIHDWNGAIEIRGAAAEAALSGWSSYESTAGAAIAARKARTPAQSGWQRVFLFLRALAIFVAFVWAITFVARQMLPKPATDTVKYDSDRR